MCFAELFKSAVLLDGGALEERIAEMKEFLGLSPDRSFQDIDVDEDEDDGR